VLHARQRTGRANTARGTARFVEELAARVRRAGASGELTLRADSGFWSAKTIRACRRHQIRYSITVRQTKPIRTAIQAIDQDAWVDIVYPDGGLAQLAETRYRGDRLVVRRTRLVGAQAELFPPGATTPSSPTGSAPLSSWTPLPLNARLQTHLGSA